MSQLFYTNQNRRVLKKPSRFSRISPPPCDPGGGRQCVILCHKETPARQTREKYKRQYANHTAKKVLRIGYVQGTKCNHRDLVDLARAGFTFEVCYDQTCKERGQIYAQLLKQYFAWIEAFAANSDIPIDRIEYTEELACLISQVELGVTYLFCNGKLHCSDPPPQRHDSKQRHAEVVFIEYCEQDQEWLLLNKNRRVNIWISNSPCHECSEKLLRFIISQGIMFCINIGKIYNPKDWNLRGMLCLSVHGNVTFEQWIRYSKDNLDQSNKTKECILMLQRADQSIGRSPRYPPPYIRSFSSP